VARTRTRIGTLDATTYPLPEGKDLIIQIKRKFGILVEKDGDGYYVASVPTLPGCHTQARSLEELLERVKEAIEAYLEAEKDTEISEFIGVLVVEAEAG
jgi:predicted RNase H-like HicB family nuclease